VSGNPAIGAEPTPLGGKFPDIGPIPVTGKLAGGGPPIGLDVMAGTFAGGGPPIGLIVPPGIGPPGTFATMPVVTIGALGVPGTRVSSVMNEGSA
jgi:hypothetical protein